MFTSPIENALSENGTHPGESVELRQRRLVEIDQSRTPCARGGSGRGAAATTGGRVGAFAGTEVDPASVDEWCGQVDRSQLMAGSDSPR